MKHVQLDLPYAVAGKLLGNRRMCVFKGLGLMLARSRDQHDRTEGDGSMWYELCEPITWIWFNRTSSSATARLPQTIQHRTRLHNGANANRRIEPLVDDLVEA